MSGLTVAINTIITGARWQFTRLDGSFLDLPNEFELVETGTSRRYSVIDKLRADGGSVIGDGTYKQRSYSIKYTAYADNNTTYRDTINEIEAFFRNNQRPFFVHDADNSIRSEIIPVSNKMSQKRGSQQRASDNDLKVVLVDGMWEDETATTYPTTGDIGTGGTGTGQTGTGTGQIFGILMSNNEEITVTNNSLFDAYPILTMEAQDNVSNFIFTNETLGGGFKLVSNDFVSGAVMVMNSTTGSLLIDDVERSSSINSGGFIRLQAGDNVLKYQSDFGESLVKLEWRGRYVV